MTTEHPFSGMPQPVTTSVTKPISPSYPSTPPTLNDSRTVNVREPYDDPLRKWIVVDHDGSETWFSGHDGAWGWFMASTLAVRLYLIVGHKRTLLGGLPYHSKPWHPSSLARPFTPKIGATVPCYTQSTICIGVCRFDDKGWRFFPNQTIPEFTGNHKPGVKFHPNYKACIPAWAAPLITKWVLVE